MEAEVEEHLLRFKHLVDEEGKRLVVEERRDARTYGAHRGRADSHHAPARGRPGIDTLLSVLYLKGISTDDFPTALEAILGPQAKGLSASTVVRLKDIRTDEYHEWSKRGLCDKHPVSVWADGVYCNARLADERSCLLVLMGADSFGNKELLAVCDGFRESRQSGKELRPAVRSRGLKKPPALAVCDGARGFQAAAAQGWSKTHIRRCRFHKSGNVIDKLPKALQAKAKGMLHDQYLAPTREDAPAAFSLFVDSFKDEYPKAVGRLAKDKDDLFAFYDFPAAQWCHLRTTNPIESTFATVRLRRRRTKGNGTRKAALAMVSKLCRETEAGRQRLDGYKQIPLGEAGIEFVNGEQVNETAA